MLAGFHFFFGSSLASASSNNIISSFIIGILSHHLLDKTPHLDLNIFKENKLGSLKNWKLKHYLLVISEFLLFLILSFYFIGRFDKNLQKIAFFGGLGAIFPDIFTLFLKTFLPKVRIFDFYLNFHKNFHFKYKNRIFLPLLNQIITLTLALILFLGKINTGY